MKIGPLALDNMTILAPLAGITNLPFRLLAKESGCALVCSEMVSANGLVRHSRKTELMLDSTPEEKPLSIQIFGADPAVMAEAAAMVEAVGADVLDVNFGCAVKKVVKTGAGVALMREPQHAEKLIKAVRNAITIPFTLKMRSGWDKSGDQAFGLAKIAEACGVDAVVLHPRVASQGFDGHADWSLIATLKKQVSIPVVGNGDIFSAEDALQMLQTTGCDFVMIGRAAIGNPWIFSQINARIRGEKIPVIDLLSRFQTMRRYLTISVRYFGEKQACFMMRSRLAWFVKGLPYSSKFRESIKQVSSEAEAGELIQVYFDFLKRNHMHSLRNI